ncbi:MAG: arylsulfatase [Rikenellaceae bacterium]
MKNQKLILSVGALAMAAPALVQAAPSKTPNVIYILADDLGYADIGCYGQKIMATPNLDRMAKGGIQFMQHYAGCTVSAPSRCALMTGKHTGNTHVRGNMGVDNSDGRVYDTTLPADEITVAELFKQRDYTTACIGKWGLGGPGTEGHPNAQGFDYFYGYLGQGYAHSYFPLFLHENETEVELGGKSYSHDLVEDKAMAFITENKDNPFFIYLTFTLPHAELLLPDEYMTKFLDKLGPESPFVNNGGTYSSQEQPHAAFAAMVERLDVSVGRINDLLKELGIDENTLVIFASDNGAHEEGGADPKYFNSTGIYRGVKRDFYEGGIRVPMIAYWPGVVPAGVQNNEMSTFWDFMPTVAELIKVKTPACSDGISILPTLMGKKQKQTHDHLYWEFHEQGGKQCVRKGDWKLIRFQVKNPNKTYYEMYNLANDPSEKNNVVNQNPELKAELIAIMDSSRTESEIFVM